MIKIEEISYNDERVLTIGLEEDDKTLVFVDKTGNSIKLGTSGMLFESPKDISFKATGNIKIEAMGGIQSKANSAVKIDGLNVAVNARTSFSAKGNASAELSASGQTIVKGAMVMIN